jgi:hypothetical protein
MAEPFDYTRLMADMCVRLGPVGAVDLAETQILTLSEIGVSPDSLAGWRQALRAFKKEHGLPGDPAREARFDSVVEFLSRRDRTPLEPLSW